jgi:predicted transcriptional regulator
MAQAEYLIGNEKISRLEKVKDFIYRLEAPEDLTIEKLNFIFNLIDDQTVYSPENIIDGLEKVDLNRNSLDGLNHRRSEMELVAFILKAARNMVNKTEILHKANLSSRQLRKYLLFLTTAGFLSEDSKKKRILYKTSSKGNLFLFHWVKILQLLETEPDSQQ